MIKGPMSPGEKGAKENKEEAYKTHLWLDMMDKFATGVQSLKFDKYLENPTLPPELKKDVKICLIDDGVDSSHKSITECMAQDGRSFAHYRQHEFRGMSRPYYESTTNHGTLMANMICRVFPNAKITSYRLNTQVGDEDKVHFTAQSAAEVSCITSPYSQLNQKPSADLLTADLGPRVRSRQGARFRRHLDVVDDSAPRARRRGQQCGRDRYPRRGPTLGRRQQHPRLLRGARLGRHEP